MTGQINFRRYSQAALCLLLCAFSASAQNFTLENQVVSTPDQKLYLITQGRRSLILNPAWIDRSPYAGRPPVPVSLEQIQTIPFGRDLIFLSVRKQILTVLLIAGFFLFFFFSKYGFPLPSAIARFDPFPIRVLCFAAFVAATLLREPFLLLHPRFWAEEGTSWFQYAGTHSMLSSVVYVQPFVGYLNLLANLGAIAAAKTAAWFGLPFAPLATTVLALLVQVFIFAIVLFGSSVVFDSLWKALAGCMIALFAPTATDEVWLNTINVITYMGLISLLLLFERTWNWPTPWRWLSRGILALCALSSPYSVALIPLFLVVAWQGKHKEQKIQSLILVLCLLVQVGVAVHSRTSQPKAWNVRATSVELPASLIDVFCENIAFPALGYPAYELLIGRLGLREAWTMSSSVPPRPPAGSAARAACFCFVFIASLLWLLKGPSLFCPRSILIAAFLTVSILVCLAAIGSTPLGRYAFLPGATFLLLLLESAAASKSRATSCVPMLILSCGLANGLIAFRSIGVQRGPSWSTEVQLWQADHRHILQVWPASWIRTDGGIALNGGGAAR